MSFVNFVARKRGNSDWSVGNDGNTKQIDDYELNIEMNQVCVSWTGKLCSKAMSLPKQKLQAIIHLSWGTHPCVCMHGWLSFEGLGAALKVSNSLRLFKPKTLLTWAAVWDVGTQLLQQLLCCRDSINSFTV